MPMPPSDFGRINVAIGRIFLLLFPFVKFLTSLVTVLLTSFGLGMILAMNHSLDSASEFTIVALAIRLSFLCPHFFSDHCIPLIIRFHSAVLSSLCPTQRPRYLSPLCTSMRSTFSNAFGT
jgi:hypothetical protein